MNRPGTGRVDRDWSDDVAWDDEAETLGMMARFLTATAPKESFETYLTERQSVYPVVKYYAEHGSWRTIGTDAIPDDEYWEIMDSLPHQSPNNCYYNAQTGLLPELTYVEGYAVNHNFPAAVPHAWLEYDGIVLEITPTISDDTRYYYGTQFENRVVRNAMRDREQADPIVEYVLTSDTE